MKNKRILVVSSYPIVRPRHGGQKRAKAIYDLYSSIFKSVRYVGIFRKDAYPDYGPDDILIGQPQMIQKINEAPHFSDLLSGEAINVDLEVRHRMAELLKSHKPDIIHIEQVYPYYGLVPLLKELGIRTKLVYGSQNIEYSMKEKMYKELGLPEKTSKPVVDKIKSLEEEFSRQAELVVAVNQEDANTLKEMGAKRCTVAPNGIEKVIPSEEAIKYWQDFKKQNEVDNIVVFVGSGHPPNWRGFMSLIGDDLSFMPKKTKLVIAGGVSSYFKTKYGQDKATIKKLWSRISIEDSPSDDTLAGLINQSEAILLPITTARGSNLKTAEAILSTKKIVASEHAFKGYEQFSGLPNIFLAKDRDGFRASILSALDTPYVKPTKTEVELIQKVQWQFSLAPLARATKKLSRPSLEDMVFKSRNTVGRLRERLTRLKR